MRKQKSVGKPLFGKKEESSIQPVVEQDKPKRRGRPPKTEQVGSRPEAEKKIRSKKSAEKKKVEPRVDDRPWKDYYESRPGDHVPCEFYVMMGRKKSPVGRGYIEDGYIIYTDEPYYIIGKRKKYGNLYYREIGCPNLDNCPNGFPSCKMCKGGKK